jgi:hypothetical protein
MELASLHFPDTFSHKSDIYRSWDDCGTSSKRFWPYLGIVIRNVDSSLLWVFYGNTISKYQSLKTQKLSTHTSHNLGNFAAQVRPHVGYLIGPLE